jgi:diguanylate cyclase (GGDEF)-like protein/PAS domain S-box-containing protein
MKDEGKTKEQLINELARLRLRNSELEEIAAENKLVDDALKESEKRYYSLFTNMLDGFAYCKMLFDDNGRPADFIYLEVNSAFGRLTGLGDVAGKKVTEVIPGIKESHPELLEIYGRVALTGQPEKFEIELKPLGIWFSVSVYSTRKEYFVAVFDNITKRKRVEEQLRNLSITDELTGLYNRRGFFTLAEREFKLAKRMKRGIFMLYADLDGMKAINDTFGHHEGDKVLKEVANVLRETYRDSDIIARVGGDEFVIIPVGVTGDDIEIITSRLQKGINDYNSKINRSYKVSLSAGIAFYDPERPCSMDQLLAEADKSMYEQKRSKQKATGTAHACL